MLTNLVYPDGVVGILSFGALMTALRSRLKAGKGCLVDLSQREATTMLLGESILDFSVTGRIAGAMENLHRDMSPHGVYPCLGEDMWVAIAVGTEDEWRGLCMALGDSELASDNRFCDRESRHANQNELDAIIALWTRELDHYEAMHRLQSQGVPSAPVLNGNEVIIDPHLESRGFWDVVDHPEAGTYKQITTPWTLSASPRSTSIPAPGLGEHNLQILNGLLGLPQSEIDILTQRGVIGDTPTD